MLLLTVAEKKNTCKLFLFCREKLEHKEPTEKGAQLGKKKLNELKRTEILKNLTHE